MAETVLPPYPIYMVRHGATDLNLQQRFQGHLDAPLSDAGRRQAERLGNKLRDLLDERERAQIPLQCSPLKRSFQTMNAIAAALGREERDIRQVDDLVEMGFGRWEGMTTLEVKAEFPEERRARKLDRWSFAPQGGESYATAAGRVAKWFEARTSPVLAVTHLGVMRAATIVTGGYCREDAFKLVPEHDEIWMFSPDGLQRL